MVNELLQVTLGAFRIGAFLAAMPLFASTPIPPQIKVFMSMALSFLTLSFQGPFPEAILHNNILLGVVLAREVGLGAFIGFGVRIIFVLVTLTLEFAGLQMGFSIANIINPQGSDQVSMLAAFGVNLLLLFLLSVNFHHNLFFVLTQSFQKIPIGVPDFQMGHMMGGLSQTLNDVFKASFQLAFPVVFAMFAVHLVLAIIAKAAPQMNLFFNITFVVNIVCGLLLVNLSWPGIFAQFQHFSDRMMKTGYNLW
ncbi:MAG: flagellar biosynthetic protein FliR [Deltaproteobacteria bacterium]|nr:flagellar biosynthetic protein FliR [Deltaproteobacteria bacterium]